MHLRWVVIWVVWVVWVVWACNTPCTEQSEKPRSRGAFFLRAIALIFLRHCTRPALFESTRKVLTLARRQY